MSCTFDLTKSNIFEYVESIVREKKNTRSKKEKKNCKSKENILKKK